MTDSSPKATQAGIAFLTGLDDAACSQLPPSVDYAALVDLANRGGAHTDEAALRDAFSMIMRARLLAAAAPRARDMTAICGFWANRSETDPGQACERMLAAQAVYAPGPAVITREDDVALGRRLFSLLPEDRFDRGPQQGVSGRWMLVADLRLDNRQELCEQMGVSLEAARLVSDAGVLMLAIERWGEGAAERLAGDFAFAAWNRDQQRLILARDFMGNRPLHYHRSDRFLAFSSMAKGLHALPEIPYAPDEKAIVRFLALAPGDGTQTYFEGIRSVPGGHLCIVTRQGIETRRFWNPSPEPLRLKRAEDYQDAVREAMDRAVSRRLRGADGRVASHLSGGIDSAVVTATAARLLAPQAGQVTAYTAAPREGFDDPLPRDRFAEEGVHAAGMAAAYPNIDHVIIRSGAGSPLAGLDRNAFLYEAPVLNLCNAVWSDAINDAAKAQGLRVMLTGEAGNLSFSFAGWQRLPQLLRQGRMLRLARETFDLRRNGFGSRRAVSETIGAHLSQSLWTAITRWRGRAVQTGDYSLANPAAAEAARVNIEATGFFVGRRPQKDAFDQRVKLFGLVDMGARYKGTLGGWGLDTRDPTSDRNLVELCLRIPMEQYLRGGWTRALARSAFADRVPSMILNETRKGLQAADWYDGFSSAQKQVIEEVDRLAAIEAAAGMFDIDRMRELVADWPEGGWGDKKTQTTYRLALLRSLSGGHFLRKALRAN